MLAFKWRRSNYVDLSALLLVAGADCAFGKAARRRLVARLSNHLLHRVPHCAVVLVVLSPSVCSSLLISLVHSSMSQFLVLLPVTASTVWASLAKRSCWLFPSPSSFFYFSWDSIDSFSHPLPRAAPDQLKDKLGRSALYYAAINKDARGVELLAREKVPGALEVAAALDFDSILNEHLGPQTTAPIQLSQ